MSRSLEAELRATLRECAALMPADADLRLAADRLLAACDVARPDGCGSGRSSAASASLLQVAPSPPFYCSPRQTGHWASALWGCRWRTRTGAQLRSRQRQRR